MPTLQQDNFKEKVPKNWKWEGELWKDDLHIFSTNLIELRFYFVMFHSDYKQQKFFLSTSFGAKMTTTLASSVTRLGDFSKFFGDKF